MNESDNNFLAYSKSATIGAIAGALAKAHGEIKNPAFDKKNPHFNARYASLASCLDSVRSALSKNGIALIQTISTPSHDWVTITTILAHSSGEWISCDFGARADAKIQQTGATVTYLRRYTLSAILGIVGDEDDDGDSDRKADTRPAAKPASDPVFSKAEANGLLKALAAKDLGFEHLMEAMKRAGLDPMPEITAWPSVWKPRIKSWLDTQVKKKPEEAPTDA